MLRDGRHMGSNGPWRVWGSGLDIAPQKTREVPQHLQLWVTGTLSLLDSHLPTPPTSSWLVRKQHPPELSHTARFLHLQNETNTKAGQDFIWAIGLLTFRRPNTLGWCYPKCGPMISSIGLAWAVTDYTCRFSGPTLGLLNQKVWGGPHFLLQHPCM